MHIITAVTGASGAIYCKRFVQTINEMGHQQTIIMTDTAKEVFSHELGLNLPADINDFCLFLTSNWDLSDQSGINCEDINNLNSSLASGSRAPDAMVIIPCTMGTIARVSQGLASNLLERAFDVMLKEKKKLITVPRETPFNQIHLKNMIKLSKMNVDIIPAMPAFYHHPENMIDMVDFVVGKVIEHLSLEHSLYQRWREEEQKIKED